MERVERVYQSTPVVTIMPSRCHLLHALPLSHTYTQNEEEDDAIEELH